MDEGSGDGRNDATSGTEVEVANWRRNFFTIWTGESISLVGSWLVQFALVWWLTLETRSATVLAVAMIATILPQVAVGPFAGAFVDRWNRKKVMIFADLSVALATLVLVILFWSGLVQVWSVIVILFAGSVGGAFQRPAFMSSMSLMVPKKHLARVNGVNQSIFGIGNIGAPVFGAILLAFVPMYGILAIDIGTAAVAISAVLVTPIPQPSSTAEKSKSVLGDVRQGLRFVRGWPGAMTLMLAAMIINFLFTPTETLLPILTIEHYHGGAPEFAAFQASIGVGMILGGIALGVWGGFRRKMVTVAAGLAVSGPAMAVPGIMPSNLFAAALGGIFAVGFFISMVNASIMAILQSSIPPLMQGRVFALLGSASMVMTPLGLAIGGPAADLLGPQLWYVLAGMCTLAIGLCAFAMPHLMRLEDGPPMPKTSDPLLGTVSK
jgi:DHA3 family macrolide efflux protein-like MFS transporter